MANPAFSAVRFDRSILNNFTILFNYVSSFTKQKAGLAGGAGPEELIVNIAKNYPLPLQFPPKITKHERPFAVNSQKNLAKEPFVTFKENDGQKLTLEFTYIVEGGYWTGARISAILKKLRSYPMTFAGEGGFTNIRVLIPRFWLFGGYDEGGNYKDQADIAPFVFENINISFTDTLIADRGSSGVAYDKVFPLRTNVAIGLLTCDSDLVEPGKAEADKPSEYRTPRPVEWQ